MWLPRDVAASEVVSMPPHLRTIGEVQVSDDVELHADAPRDRAVNRGEETKVKCCKCAVGTEILEKLGQQGFVNLISALCRQCDGSSFVIRLKDGRVVKGELISIDASMNILMRHAREEITIPWPSLDAVTSKNHRRAQTNKPDKERQGRIVPPVEESKEDQDMKVSAQRVERSRFCTIILGSQIESVEVRAETFSRAVSQSENSPAAVFL